jgi:hypothetical protein
LLTLAADDERRQDHQLGVLGQFQHRVDHLRHRLRRQFDAVLRATRRAGAGEQQTQVIVDLGDRTHGGTRIVRGRLLLDGDGRTEAFDQVDIRLFHQLQELPGIGRERFDIAPLALGVERIEGQGRLARAGQTGDHRQLVVRQIEADILQIVGAGAANADHGISRLGTTAHYTQFAESGSTLNSAAIIPDT